VLQQAPTEYDLTSLSAEARKSEILVELENELSKSEILVEEKLPMGNIVSEIASRPLISEMLPVV